MKTRVLSVRLEPELNKLLDRLAKRMGKSRSELARDAISRRVALMQFEESRKHIMPLANARGYLTDDDIFRA